MAALVSVLRVHVAARFRLSCLESEAGMVESELRSADPVSHDELDRWAMLRMSIE